MPLETAGIQLELFRTVEEVNPKLLSVKEYNSSFKIPREEMLEMLREATKAPSSVNLQPWRFVVVDERKERLKSLVRFNQRLITAS